MSSSAWTGQQLAHVRLAVERADNDPPHGLQLDLIRALLERVSEVLRRRGVEEVIMNDGVAR